jgi:hypothetical protein
MALALELERKVAHATTPMARAAAQNCLGTGCVAERTRAGPDAPVAVPGTDAPIVDMELKTQAERGVCA